MCGVHRTTSQQSHHITRKYEKQHGNANERRSRSAHTYSFREECATCATWIDRIAQQHSHFIAIISFLHHKLENESNQREKEAHNVELQEVCGCGGWVVVMAVVVVSVALDVVRGRGRHCGGSEVEQVLVVVVAVVEWCWC